MNYAAFQKFSNPAPGAWATDFCGCKELNGKFANANKKRVLTINMTK